MCHFLTYYHTIKMYFKSKSQNYYHHSKNSNTKIPFTQFPNTKTQTQIPAHTHKKFITNLRFKDVECGGIASLIILLGAIFCQGGDGASHTTLTKLAYKSFIKDAIPPHSTSLNRKFVMNPPQSLLISLQIYK